MRCLASVRRIESTIVRKFLAESPASPCSTSASTALMVTTRRAAAAQRARAAAMAFSKLSGDEQGIILDQLRNALEPRLVMYFSSASKELRALLPPAVQQQLRTDYEEATALCLKMGMRNCKKLRERILSSHWIIVASRSSLQSRMPTLRHSAVASS